MAASNFPNGFSQGVTIRGVPILNTHSGKVYWVDSNGSYNDNYAGTFDKPFSSIENAFNYGALTAGDIVMCKAGHVETVTEAGGLDLDVAGVAVVFLGEGASQAYITFTTAATADMDIDAASITLVRPKFVVGIDSLSGPIDVNATDFTIIDGTWYDATDVETTDCIIATAGATRLTIDGWKFYCGTETGDQKQSHIQINGCDDIVLKNIDIRGDFFVGCIENVTDEVLNARFENLNLENLNATPKPALFLDANATGTCKNVKLHVASGTTYASSYGKMAYDNQCEGFSGVTSPAGDQLGTAASTGIEGKIDIIDGYHDVATADAVTNVVMSDVIGNKTDAAINAVTTTKTLMAYLKGVLNEITVPGADNTDNAFINDVIGQKTDAAATGAVTATDTAMGYIKQLVTELAVVDGYHDVQTADVATNTQMRDVVGNKTDAAVGTVAADKSLMAYLKGVLTDTGTTLPATLAAMPQTIEKTDGAVLLGNDDLFVIAGGPVRCKITGLVTTVIGGAANMKLQITTTTPAATVDLNAGAVAIDADAAGTIYQNIGAGSTFTPSAGLGYAFADPVTVEETELILTPGTVHANSSAAQTGVIAWYMTYVPLSPSATVTAAA